ncbi:MAG: type II toxin-antitoxin system mRNA interferase toxin, RelE/StbE family [Candidatus Methylomirabilis oxyfera]|nr:type II toxin-antitoxin system mRNA interferase toxin, RelE/StbE family [Candidatus Methylomirabilis oxyfera]
MDAYKIVLKRSATADLDAVRKYDATQIADAMEKHLQHDPTKESKSRIKRLRGISNPDYRLRVGDYRVFYVVDEDARRVDVLRIMHEDQTLPYYKELQR